MNCFICGAPATHMHTYDVSVGFFAIGSEPRTCAGCTDVLREMPDSERQTRYINGGFEITRDPPSGASNPIDDIINREPGLKNRGST